MASPLRLAAVRGGAGLASMLISMTAACTSH